MSTLTINLNVPPPQLKIVPLDSDQTPIIIPVNQEGQMRVPSKSDYQGTAIGVFLNGRFKPIITINTGNGPQTDHSIARVLISMVRYKKTNGLRNRSPMDSNDFDRLWQEGIDYVKAGTHYLFNQGFEFGDAFLRSLKDTNEIFETRGRDNGTL